MGRYGPKTAWAVELRVRVSTNHPRKTSRWAPFWPCSFHRTRREARAELDRWNTFRIGIATRIRRYQMVEGR